MSFLLAEDEAVKALLTPLYVTDDKMNPRPVKSWFGQPDLELREQSYPYITIDLIDITEATERTMRGYIHLDYVPDGEADPEDGFGYNTYYPIPYNLDYQITSYARHPRHDREIIRELLQNRFGSRMHSLYVPVDGTTRSMFLMQQVKRDTTEQNKRLFRNAFTVRVFSELLPAEIDKAKQVIAVTNSINLSINETVHRPTQNP